LALAAVEQAADPPLAEKQGCRRDAARSLAVDAVEMRTFGDEEVGPESQRESRSVVVVVLPHCIERLCPTRAMGLRALTRNVPAVMMRS
jgi:hypothetical protein